MNKTDCNHNWKYRAGSDNICCYECKWFPAFDRRWKCQNCLKQLCNTCIKKNFDIDKPDIPETSKTEENKIQDLEGKVETLESKIQDINNKMDLLLKILEKQEKTKINQKEDNKQGIISISTTF